MKRNNNEYNKGCFEIGKWIFVFVYFPSIMLGYLLKCVDIHLPKTVLIVWFMIYFLILVIALHVLIGVHSKGYLKYFYGSSLWLLQSVFIGVCVHANISKSHWFQFIYIAVFSCIVLISYCVIFSPMLFLKFNINPSVNRVFRMLDDLHNSVDNSKYEERKEETIIDVQIGVIGKSETVLRPTGRGRFGGHLLHISTRGEFITENVTIKIIKKVGNLYIVEECIEGNDSNLETDNT